MVVYRDMVMNLVLEGFCNSEFQVVARIMSMLCGFHPCL